MAGIAVAEVSKKTGIRKKAVRVRAYRYRKLGIPLKYFPPVELPDWDELAEYAASLAPPEQADANDDDEDEEEDLEDSSDVEEGETAPAAREEIGDTLSAR